MLDRFFLSELEKLGVELIYLFGSKAQGFITPLSDIDIGVVFANPNHYRHNVLKVYEKLFGLFLKIFPETSKIDIVFLQFAPLALQFRATRYGKVLYKKNHQSLFRYKEEILKRYADMRYFLNLRYKAILERI